IIHGDAYKQQRVIRDTNVVVIGAGTAGMEAACTAAEVGCHTWLLEEKHSIGGLASEISLLPEKKRIADFPQFMKNRIASLDNLMLQVGKRATVASVSALRPNLIVNATGSVPLLPPIEGLRENIDVEGGNVFSITNMIHHLDQFADATGKRIAVVGAGAVGLDVIEYFSARGASAVLIEMQDAPGRDLDIITKNAMLTMLDEHHVEQHMRTQLVAVTPTHFTVKNADGAFNIPFDYGFVCLGMRANTAGLNEIEQWARANNVKIMNIGDSLMARRIIDGVREGRNVLDTLEDMGALGNRESTKIPFLTY
ncbi:2,4-dienoyl-CoA reductase, partial [Klebsiella michiganensis]